MGDVSHRLLDTNVFPEVIPVKLDEVGHKASKETQHFSLGYFLGGLMECDSNDVFGFVPWWPQHLGFSRSNFFHFFLSYLPSV